MSRRDMSGWLFTPGPLTTSPAVRAAMNRDMGSRSAAFREITADVCRSLLALTEASTGCAVVPVQGSGTFAVEAMLSTFPDRGRDRVLIAVNGDYARRMAQICAAHGLEHRIVETDPRRPIDIARVEEALAADPAITHVAAVHFETGLGVLNDIEAVARAARAHDCRVLIDAISSFGALPVGFACTSVEAIAVSANKCLHGVPGAAFVIARCTALEAEAQATTLALDLRAQWRELVRTGQWRFTPPVQTMLALRQALHEHAAAGGTSARLVRYRKLADRLVGNLAPFGIAPAIAAAHRAPMIATFLLPDHAGLSAATLIRRLEGQGMTVYPSRLEDDRSFRLGCMGEIGPRQIDRLSRAIGAILGYPVRAATRRA